MIGDRARPSSFHASRPGGGAPEEKLDMQNDTARRMWLAAVFLGAAVSTASAQEVLQVRAKEIVLGDGNRVEDGLLVVEDGRIARVGAGTEVDEDLPLIEHDGVLTAGMVACQTHSGTRGDDDDQQRSFLPEARIVHAFDPDHSDFEKALEAGITSVVLAPGGDNVAGGMTAVVKTAGGTVLARDAHLALSFSGSALGQSTASFFFFFGSAQAPTAADGGPENTDRARRGTREPTSYSGALRMLRERFDDPDGPYARARRGEIPVFLEAWDRHEVLRAATFAREEGLRGAIYGAPLAGDPALVRALAESGLGVILGPYSIGQLSRSLDSVRALQEAGVAVAFALDGPTHDPAELRLSAALALFAGADAGSVWRALTADAARIAGVDARVGTLERGKDADFVLWSGDPLNLESRVEAVYVDGKLAHASDEGQESGGGSR